MHISIEPSKSGSTFGVAIHKTKDEKPFMVVKGCRLVGGNNGMFVSGPATKMNDGKWFNYIFMDKAFGEYITKLAQEAMPQQSSQSAQSKSDDSDDVPF
jgi:DNA-binding cell septation regulator SpoVG